MTRWPRVALGNFVAEKSGSVDPSKFPEELFDLYSIPAFDVGQPDVSAGSEIGSTKQVVQPGDVLLSRIIPHIRRAWVVGENRGRRLIASGEWIVFRSSQIHPRYLRLFLVGDSFHSQFMNTVSGVGGSLLRAKLSEVVKIQIPLPPIGEQKRIVKLLDEADGLRKLRAKAEHRSAALIPALFHEIFGDPQVNPKGCKVVRLQEVATRITDGVHLKPNYVATGVPFISVKNITTGVLNFNGCKFISREDHERFTKRCKPECLDILYTKVGATYGRPALVDTATEFSIYVSVCLIKPIHEIIDSHFLATTLGTPAIKRQADRSIKGIGVPDLHLDQIQKFVLPLPPLPQQKEFAKRSTEIQGLGGEQGASRRRLEDLFQSLLHRAFRGEL